MTKIIIILALLHCIKATSFIQNNIGRLHISNKKWEIQYGLNLTEYKETTKLLQECMDTLSTICERGQNPLCPLFLHETQNINTELQADISKLNALSRQKRFIIFIPVVIGVALLSFWAGMMVAKMTLGSLQDSMQANLNILEQASNITISALNIQEQYIKDADMRFSKMENSINNNTIQIESYAKFFGIINTVLFIAHKHEKIQIKLNHVYSGETKNRIFEIFDYVELLNTMADINEQLKPDFMLPTIKSMEKNNFIETNTEINDTHLVVSIDLPVITKASSDIYELIPIPIRENNTLYILDSKIIKYYVKDLKIHILSDDVIKSLCKSQDKTTICNNFLENYTQKPSNCIYNLIMKNTDVNCEYKQIQYQNYFIKISETIIFAYIVEPTKIVKNCKGKNKILDIKNHQQISLPSGCSIYKYSDQSSYNKGQTVMTNKKSNKNTQKIELPTTQNQELLSTIPLWDKYETQFIENKGKVIRIKKDIPLQKQKIENLYVNSTLSDLLPGFNLKDILTNKLTIILVSAFVILLSLLIMKSMIIKLITNWND